MFRCSSTTMAGGRRHIPRSAKEKLVVMSDYMRSHEIGANIVCLAESALRNDW